MTVSEVADATRCSRQAVHKWIASGEIVPDETIQAQRGGKPYVVAYLFSESQIKRLLENRKEAAIA